MPRPVPGTWEIFNKTSLNKRLMYLKNTTAGWAIADLHFDGWLRAGYLLVAYDMRYGYLKFEFHELELLPW